MFAASFSDSELETLLLALKYWRYHRGDSPTRRNDRILAADEVDFLVAKLGSAHVAGRRPAADPVSDGFPH